MPITIQLSKDLFNTIFPFHLILDKHLDIIQCGVGIEKVCPQIKINTQFNYYFNILRPITTAEFNLISRNLQHTFIIEYKINPITFKGQMARKEDYLIFLGSPIIQDLTTLKKFGLTVNDFTLHDRVIDFLFVLQSQNIALSDARTLADNLQQEKENLEKANIKLAEQAKLLKKQIKLIEKKRIS